MTLIPETALLFLGSSSNQYTPTLPMGWIVAFLVCNGRRRQQIGGWLLFYYWQLYSGILMTALFFFLAFQSYVPESYDDPNKYYLFLASVVPTLVLLALEIAVATILISVRTWDLIRLLRWLMVASVAASAVATAIDIKYFPDSLVFDAMTILPAIFWVAYFFRSRRVQHVFKSHDWDVAVNTIYPAKAAATT